MSGVMVDEQAPPLNTPMSSENAVDSLQPSSQAESADGASLFDSFFSNNDCAASHFLRPNLLAFEGTHHFDIQSSSPFEQGGTCKSKLEDESLSISFSRSMPNIGRQTVFSVGEVGGDATSRTDGMVSETGEESSTQLGLSSIDSNDSVNGPSFTMPTVCSTFGGGQLVGSPVFSDTIRALQKYLPSNQEDEAWPAIDAYSSDEFRMYEFKVRKCMRGRSHDWTECPFAHPGEKARRRDPRRFHYSGTACPDFRKGSCKRGDSCEYAHGVFECWLHPARYRTQPCKDGRSCRRRVCFFAHTQEQLRPLSGSFQMSNSASRASLHSSSVLKVSLSGCYDGSPLRQALAGSLDSTLALESMTSHRHSGNFGSGDGNLTSPRSDHWSFMGKTVNAGGCSFLHMFSPTSTLVGHSESPPPSPTVSPPTSPPLSPHSPSKGYIAVVRSQGTLQQPLIQPPESPLLHSVHSETPGSILTSDLSSGSKTVLTGGCHDSSMFSPIVSGHRHHLDRFNSLPSVSIPAFEGGDIPRVASACSGSSEIVPSSAMTPLIATIQRLGLAHVTDTHFSSTSSLRHYAASLPGTPRKVRWEREYDAWSTDNFEAEPRIERVESGRDLRAKIYGRLRNQNPLENESPDLDWVNELVK